MLIVLRTQVNRTDKTPVTARRVRVGATSGFLLLDGYALGWAAKAAQTADTGATAWEWCFCCAFNPCFQ